MQIQFSSKSLKALPQLPQAMRLSDDCSKNAFLLHLLQLIFDPCVLKTMAIGHETLPR